MPKFITIGYGNQAGYDRTIPKVRNDAHAHDALLRRDGMLVGVAGNPIQVRNPNALDVQIVKGAYMSSPLPIAGFTVIEAADLSEATELASRTPCAVAYGVVEIWPLEESC